MRIEYDMDNAETVLHLNAEEMGEVLFVLDLAGIDASNPEQRRKAKVMYAALREGMLTAPRVLSNDA